MKLLASHSSFSPSSSSSSSSLSFDSTMCSSKKAASGCLTGILRRILCSGGLPTHPSDQIREMDSTEKDEEDQELKAKQQNEAAATTTLSTPGIVARLMGLESMVESAASSLSRSRSMNSIDSFGEFNRTQGLHRRVKSTLSFREVPTFVLLENDNFLVLSFERGDKDMKFKSKEREGEMGSAELKQKRAEGRKFKESRKERVSSEKILSDKEKQSRRVCDDKPQEVANTLPMFKKPSEKKHIHSEAEKLEEVLNGEKLKRRRRRKKKTSSCTAKKIELECNSEDSSPVSVLDFERQVPGSEADSLSVSLSSRRKLSPELENDQNLLLRFDGNLMVEQRKIKEGQKFEGPEREEERKEYIDIWGEVGRLAEDEFLNDTEAGMWKQGDCGSISADFESEIFGHLLNELIDQLLVVGRPMKMKTL